jgi:surface polysaccharide O-acyltransferase-like enzyme
LKALNEEIDDSLKPYPEEDLKAVLKSLTRFSVPMFFTCAAVMTPT